MLEIVLQALKFVAIRVGTISGAVGTLTETRDKATGLPTPWARRIVALVILSGVLAVVTQAVESYLHKQDDAKEQARRTEADTQTTKILANASAAATGITAARTTQDETLHATQQTLTDLQRLQIRAENMHRDILEQQRFERPPSASRAQLPRFRA